MLTDLDRRYRVIAFSTYSNTQSPRGIVEGFPFLIRERITWWPEGFRQSASEDHSAPYWMKWWLRRTRVTATGVYTSEVPTLLCYGTQEE
jgi:hypothetical protein